MTMQECSARYQAAKTDGTLKGRLWNDLRKEECGGNDVTPGRAVFPTTIAPQYSNEEPHLSRMHTCADQWKANKAANTTGGMKWVDVGGAGYYPECNRRLKG